MTVRVMDGEVTPAPWALSLHAPSPSGARAAVVYRSRSGRAVDPFADLGEGEWLVIRGSAGP